LSRSSEIRNGTWLIASIRARTRRARSPRRGRAFHAGQQDGVRLVRGRTRTAREARRHKPRAA
jgi:hypothetical protein